MPRPRIIVSGLIAQYPLGGVAWDYVQYVAGLARLGYDAYYVEDTGIWPYNPEEGGISKICDYNVRYLQQLMDRFGLGSRWAYCFPHGSQWFGLSDASRKEVIETADLLLNISGTLAAPAKYRSVRRLAYIDSDPVFTQVKLARGETSLASLMVAHDVHFSFGEALPGNTPPTQYAWIPTRQPILLDEWPAIDERREVFTTVMNWTTARPIVHEGVRYGQKDIEFERFIDLPARVKPTELEIAVNLGKTRKTPYDLLRHKGWRLADPDTVCPDLDSYRHYLSASKAEWSVAKNGYVVGKSGWFSCRSACYLAAGRPVVVEDTGFDAVIPTGRGVLSFSNPDEAVADIREVEANYDAHARAAREIAHQYFDARKVLERLVEAALAG
ncbi:MAG TPA: glycosyltransferase [Methylomirabilota bacterium]|nr:glycosyltransferase [Methylomirabilota bacterium]